MRPGPEAADAEPAVAVGGGGCARHRAARRILVPGAFEAVPRLAPARVVLVSSRPPEELATAAAAAGAVG